MVLLWKAGIRLHGACIIVATCIINALTSYKSREFVGSGISMRHNDRIASSGLNGV